MPSKDTTESGKKAPQKPLVVRTRRPKGSGPTVMISVRFPNAYLRVIEAEGARLALTRGNFLTMLVKREQGIVHMERPKGAPSYECTVDEMNAETKYMWESPVEVRQAIDAGRLPMGNIPVSAYLMYLVNNWLGTPKGLPIREGGRAKR